MTCRTSVVAVAAAALAAAAGGCRRPNPAYQQPTDGSRDDGEAGGAGGLGGAAGQGGGGGSPDAPPADLPRDLPADVVGADKPPDFPPDKPPDAAPGTCDEVLLIGCPSGQKCLPDCDLHVRRCVPAGPKKAGAICAAESECEPGTSCICLDEGGKLVCRCLKYCKTSDDCSGVPGSPTCLPAKCDGSGDSLPTGICI